MLCLRHQRRCGYKYSNTLTVLEADGWNNTLVAAGDPGMLYMRGYPSPETGQRSDDTFTL